MISRAANGLGAADRQAFSSQRPPALIKRGGYRSRVKASQVVVKAEIKQLVLGPEEDNGRPRADLVPYNRAKQTEPGEWFFTEGGQKAWVDAMELDMLAPDLPQLLMELGSDYNPERLAAHLDGRPTELYARALQVTAVLGTFIAALLKDYALNKLGDNQQARAAQLRELLGNLGPSFVKIGQALSARPDLLPATYLNELASLQDRLPSFPSRLAFAVIEQELGRRIEDIFSEITPEPIAAASLGQVYKARLRTTGELVAVKVQRPGIAESIAIDMLLLRRLMGLVDKRVPQVQQPLVPLVDEFASRLFSELDYVQEGKNCEKFQDLYGHIPRVATPKIVWESTSRRVLTMEWIDGVKLTNKEAMDAAGLDIVDFVGVGIECTLRQLLEDGFFHADPHPGNLLATKAGNLVYLDFGMMSRVPEEARYAIIGHVVHLVNRDYEAMCRDYYTLRFIDPSVDTSPIAPALAAFFDDVLASSVRELNFKAIVDGLGEVLFEFPFNVPAYYALILRSLTVLEGLALQANPEYRLLGQAYPYMAKRLLTDPAPELRLCFEELILHNGQIRWNRLENLLQESSKSVDYDPTQLWLLAEWLVSDSASSIQEPMVSEGVRIIDALVASDIRDRIVHRIGDQGLAERLVPVQPNERDDQRRGQVLVDALTSQLGSTVGSSWTQQQGTGVLGSWTLEDLQKGLQSAQTAMVSTAPRLRGLLDHPGAQRMLSQLSQQLSQRFAARTFKLLFSSADLGQVTIQLLSGGRGQTGVRT